MTSAGEPFAVRLPRVALTTAPDAATAREIARSLVERGIVACASLVPGVTSVYRWKGAVEEAGEVLLVLKTTDARLRELERALGELHPYEVPELVVLAPEHVEPKYLRWLVQETSAPDGAGRGGPAG